MCVFSALNNTTQPFITPTLKGKQNDIKHLSDKPCYSVTQNLLLILQGSIITSLFRERAGFGGRGWWSKSTIFSVTDMYKAYTAKILIQIKKDMMHNQKLWAKRWDDGLENRLRRRSIYIATDRRYIKALTGVQWRLCFLGTVLMWDMICVCGCVWTKGDLVCVWEEGNKGSCKKQTWQIYRLPGIHVGDEKKYEKGESSSCLWTLAAEIKKKEIKM